MRSESEGLRSRVRRLRLAAGLNQGELARELGVSRPTLTQIETGERKLSAEEASRLAPILRVSADVLLGLSREPEVVLEPGSKVAAQKPAMRISVPRRNLKKFREVLLYVLDRVGAKPNVGETVLYKLLYFIDFDYYEQYEEQLVGATYIKNSFGPTPVEFRKVVDRMTADGELTMVKSRYFDKSQRKYLPLRRPNLQALSAAEVKVIDGVLGRLSDMNARAISEHSHGDVPWLAAEPGKSIAYESVFYRTAGYSRRSDDGDVS